LAFAGQCRASFDSAQASHGLIQCNRPEALGCGQKLDPFLHIEPRIGQPIYLHTMVFNFREFFQSDSLN